MQKMADVRKEAECTCKSNQVYRPNMAIVEMGGGHSWTTSASTKEPPVRDSSTRIFHQVDRGKGTGKDNIRHSNQFHLAKDHLPIRCTEVHNSG